MPYFSEISYQFSVSLAFCMPNLTPLRIRHVKIGHERGELTYTHDGNVGSDAWAEAVIQTCGFIQICIKLRINWGFSAPYTVSHNRVSMNDEWII